MEDYYEKVPRENRVKRSILSVFINLRCADSVCLYHGLRV